ncbi:zinc finger protein 431-like isoform X2 [Toxorhynchites rutilus septentrionalis]|uniref:zinc finger protein 431-like isoform X2 n=1 Tax=Toxorhynchites rutilus septentrionalis TaxID=329112 RepID=UPI00247867C5|nr:zinc finger protein 431-like isoform X2 [Toxorhynchites rutilus septentrionalis]
MVILSQIDDEVRIFSQFCGNNLCFIYKYSITIDEEDRLPNFICEKCELNLNIIFNFKKQCEDSRRILEKVRNKTIVPNDLRKSERNDLQSWVETNNVGSDCEESLKKLPQNINVENVEGTARAEKLCEGTDAVKPDSDEIKQEVCDLGILLLETECNIEQNDGRVEEHCVETDAVKIELDKIEQGMSDLGLQNNITNLIEENRDKLLENNCSDKDWSPEIQKQTNDVTREEAEKNTSEANQERRTRSKKTASKNRFKKIPNKNICPVCGALVNNIRDHMIIHEKVRPHQCPKCPKNFTSRGKLQCHINSVHLKKRDYKCELCDKAYLERNSLKRHLRIHEDDPKFKCDLCPEAFQFAEKLRCHKLLIHIQAKKYECHVCGAIFLMRTTLNKHLKVHIDERPHKCDFCEKTFRLSYWKIAHMRTHTGEKPLLCRICGIGFPHHKGRSIHMKTKHANESILKKRAIIPDDLRKSEHSQANRAGIRNRMKKKNVKKLLNRPNCEENFKKEPQKVNVGKVEETFKMDISSDGTDAVKAKSNEIKQEVCDLGFLFLGTECNIEQNDITNLVDENYTVIHEKFEETSREEVPCTETDAVRTESDEIEQNGITNLNAENYNVKQVGSRENPELFLEDKYSNGDWSPDKLKKEPMVREKKTTVKGCSKKLPKEKTNCPICGALVHRIKPHMVLHEKVRPHKCTECPKNFATRCKLQSHINSVHLKKRDYKCELCGKAYLEKNHLKRHIRIHKGEV